MTDLITAEEAEKLLDGSTPGPWEWTTGRFSNNPYLSPNILLLAFDGGGPDGVDPNDAANARLIAAAPDLARSVIALHAQLADAQAAQAMLVERCAEEAVRTTAADGQRNIKDQWRAEIGEEVASAIRALAPIDGLALVRDLRAERDALKKKLISPDPYEDTAHPDDHAVNRFAAVMKGKLAAKRLQGRGGWQEPEVPNGYLSRMLHEHVDKGDPVDVANLAMMIHQRGERIAPQNEGASCKAIDDAIADRDRLAAANAVLEAKVAGLAEALKKADTALSDEGYRETQWPRPQIRAALATQEAGNAQSTPPISPEEAQFNAVRHHERFGPLDEKGNPLDPRRRG